MSEYTDDDGDGAEVSLDQTLSAETRHTTTIHQCCEDTQQDPDADTPRLSEIRRVMLALGLKIEWRVTPAKPGSDAPDESAELPARVTDLANAVTTHQQILDDLTVAVQHQRDEIEALSSRVAPVEARVEKTENQ